jgi:hypothetical protein
MSVVTKATRLRWAAVAAGVGLLVGVPTVTTAIAGRAGGSGAGDVAPRERIARALASARVPYTGLAESRGSLGLPDVPELESVTAQLGGITRTRVWWAAPSASRVDVLTPTGEQGIYDQVGRTVLWDYERNTVTEVLGHPPLRLPRPDDLVPPSAARRLLGGVGPADRVTALPDARVAGVAAAGVRVVPGDPRSTIGHLDVWLAAQSGLPVRVDVVDTAGVTSLTSKFTDLHLGAPDAAAIRPPDAPGAVHDTTPAPDLVSQIQRFRMVQLPAELAGLPSGEFVTGGIVTYGAGLTRFAVQPLTGGLAESALDAVRSGGAPDLELAGGEARAVTSGSVSLVVLRPTGAHGGYLVTGLVTRDVLVEAARELLANPPHRRRG